MSAILILFLIAIVLGLVAVYAIKTARKEYERAEVEQARADKYRVELVLREQAEKKAEEARRVQAERKAAIDTGDPATDFAASVNVLSDVSGKRKRKPAASGNSGGGVANVP